ncbi:hypothetical protein HHS34_005345 [Acidithiobacillus montserratensis]|uniref:Uncharacterized protein n=1 Tax=Acidithiobacillus montserratensis TaxID=2729135 RepID=A0ACD5HIZ9_9PROT|nr:hypothetical protein [Acidithiobacillus montserratensis]MBU2746592.1 hypothetical protein [Acidithiobacillus montserratensis]
MRKQIANKAKPWKSYGVDAYLTQAACLATHTTKSVNTNAAGDGVRVQVEKNTEMPYVCVRFGRDPVDLDYTNGATASPVTEQIDAVLKADFHQFSNVDQTECAVIQEQVLPLLQNSSSTGPSISISPRLRQILVDDGNGSDISLTPLHSGGLSRRLQVILDRELAGIAAEAGQGTRAFFDDVVMKVGGDKGQNAGRVHLIGAMQKAYRFAVPVDNKDPGIRKAFFIWNRGVPFWIPRVLLEGYVNFLFTLKKSDDRKKQSLQRTKSRMGEEFIHMEAIVNSVLSRADRYAEQVRPYVGSILDGFASPDLPLLQRGLLDRNLRTDAWKDVFASKLAQSIASAKTKEDKLVVGISGRSADSLRSYILEVL